MMKVCWGIVILIGVSGGPFLSVDCEKEKNGTVEYSGTDEVTLEPTAAALDLEDGVKTEEEEGTKKLKKAPGGVLGSYLAGIGSESLANNAGKIKPPAPSITRRPIVPPRPQYQVHKNPAINQGNYQGGNGYDQGNFANNNNNNYAGGFVGQGQQHQAGATGGNGVRRRRPRPTYPPVAEAPPTYFQPQPDYYEPPPPPPPKRRPQLRPQIGAGYRPQPGLANYPPPNVANGGGFGSGYGPGVAAGETLPLPQQLPPIPPPRPAEISTQKPLTEEQKLALHFLELLEEREKQQQQQLGTQQLSLSPPTVPPATTKLPLPLIVDVATTAEYDDYDPNDPDGSKKKSTTTSAPASPTRRRRRRSTTVATPPQAPPPQAPYQPPQNFYPQHQQQPPYNPYLLPPQQPPAYYPPPQYQQPQNPAYAPVPPPAYVPPPHQPPYAPPLTPAQFQQLQQQQQYQQQYHPPQQPYYPPPLPPQQQQPAFPPQPGYIPQQPPLSTNTVTQATTPLEEYDYVDTVTNPPTTTSTTSRPQPVTPNVNSVEYQQYLQLQRLQQIKILLELRRLREQQSQNGTLFSPDLQLNITTTEDPYINVPRLVINPYLSPTKLTTTTDNPNDAVQDLANLFGSLAVGNLAGVVDGTLKFASTGVFDNINTFIACRTPGKCDANGNPLDIETEDSSSSSSVGGGILGIGGGSGGGIFGDGGNSNKLPGGKTDKYSYIPHPPQHPYPGRKPGAVQG